MRKKAIGITILITFFSVFFMGHVGILNAADPYVIGYLTDITGHARHNYAPEAEGFRLYMDVVNGKGGINGHPVKVVIEDGKSEPGRSGAVAKKLIIEDKVLAICGLGFSRSQPPVLALAKKEGVAVVAGYTSVVGDVYDTQPGSISFSTGYNMHPDFHTSAYGSAKAIQGIKPRGSTVAITGFTTPGARFWRDLQEKWLKDMGYKLVYGEDIPTDTVDFSPWVNKIAKISPDIYYAIEGSTQVIPQIIGLEKMGYTKDIMIPDFTPEGDFIKGIKRLVGNGEWVLWGGRWASIYEDLPEMRRIKKTMEEFGHQYPLSARHCQGWVVGRIIEDALIRAGWPCSRSGLIAALEKTNIDTRGLTGGPIRFTPTDHFGPSWWKVYRWNAAKKALVSAIDWFKIEPKVIAKKYR
jgi:branched-chain amino acid transport system substrate-binding protein